MLFRSVMLHKCAPVQLRRVKVYVCNKALFTRDKFDTLFGEKEAIQLKRSKESESLHTKSINQILKIYQLISIFTKSFLEMNIYERQT